MIPKGVRFRWRFYDDALGETQSGWHVNSPRCGGCCCGGPRGEEHHEPVTINDEYGYSSGHARFYTDDCSAS